ncbi:MAG: MFS transporter [Sulfolobales archaeon]
MAVSRDLRLVIVVSLISSVVSGFLWSVNAPYLRQLGVQASAYGFLSGLSLLLSLLATVVSGWLSDFIEARKVLMFSLFLWGFSLILLSLGEIFMVYAYFLLGGLALGLSNVSGLVLVTRVAGGRSFDQVFPYISAVSSVGVGLGSFGGWIPLLMEEIYGFRLVEAYRIVIAFLGVVLPVSSIPLLYMIRERSAGGGGWKYSDDPESIVEKPATLRMLLGLLFKLVIVNAVVSFGAGMSIHIIDYYFVLKFNASSGDLGLVFGVQNLIMGFLMLLTPRFSIAVGGPLRAYMIIASPSILLMLAMTFSRSYLEASLLYIVRTVLMNVANPLYQAFEMSVIPSRYRGRGASLISVAWQIPAGVGRVVGGVLMEVYLEAPLIFTSMLYSVAFILLPLFFPDQVLKRFGGGRGRGF